MPIEQLTYAQIAERLGISVGAARAIVMRDRLPRSLGKDGKCRVTIDLSELHHTAVPARGASAQRGHPVAELQARVPSLESERAPEQQRSARQPAEGEREQTDRLVAKLREAGRALLAAREVPARPREGELLVVPPKPRWWRWLRSAG